MFIYQYIYSITFAVLVRFTHCTSNNPTSWPSMRMPDHVFRMKKPDTSPRTLLEQYLHSTSKDVYSIGVWSQLLELFLRLNTPLPSSAAVERLFSCAGLIMSHKRTKLTDKRFENLVFLKANEWISDKLEIEQLH